jgi:hypothetical protein
MTASFRWSNDDLAVGAAWNYSEAPFLEAAFDLVSDVPELAQSGMQDLIAFLSPAQQHAHGLLSEEPLSWGQWLQVSFAALPVAPAQPCQALAQPSPHAQIANTIWLTTPLRGGVKRTRGAGGGDDGDNSTDPTASSSTALPAKKRPAAALTFAVAAGRASTSPSVSAGTSAISPSKKRPSASLGFVAAARRACKSRPGALPTPVVSTRTKGWDHSYHLLQVWLERSKGAYPKRAGASTEERRLSQWVRNLRQAHQRPTRPQRLSPERIVRLEALPAWTWAAQQSLWEESFDSLKKWLQEHSGVYPIREGTTPEEKRLAN